MINKENKVRVSPFPGLGPGLEASYRGWPGQSCCPARAPTGGPNPGRNPEATFPEQPLVALPPGQQVVPATRGVANSGSDHRRHGIRGEEGSTRTVLRVRDQVAPQGASL